MLAHHTARTPARTMAVLAIGCAAMATACAIGIRRDYSTIPPGQVGFEDMCGLQDYFDTIESRVAMPPSIVSAIDVESQSNARIRGGKNRFAFETEFQLKNLRRVLNDNWSRLPETLPKAEKIDLEVHWSEKAGVRRVVTESDAALIIKGDSFPLPYHVCLSELLYGEPLYHQRREMTGRALPYKSLIGAGGVASAPAVAAPAPASAAPSNDVGGAVTAAPPAPAAMVAAPPAPVMIAAPASTMTAPAPPLAAPAPPLAAPAPPLAAPVAVPQFKSAPPAR
jgi:hypothetical protein